LQKTVQDFKINMVPYTHILSCHRRQCKYFNAQNTERY